MRGSRAPSVRLAATVILIGAAGLASVVTWSALHWIGRPFPGFFLLRNQVVASVSLPGWPVALAPDVFQSTLVAVNDVPVTSSADVYTEVAAAPPGTRFAYTLERGGAHTIEWMESRLFAWRDALLIFGVYLFDGVVFAAIGVSVWLLSPRRATTWALLGLCLALSTYTLTAIDLYGPSRFFRLHALAESFLPATLLHLAFVFPIRRATVRRAITVSYAPALALALVYQVHLDIPERYPGIHWLATSYLAVTGIFLLASAVWSYVRTSSEFVRNQVRVVILGLMVAFVAPVVLFCLSALDGRVPVNMTAFTAFLFPLSVAYAVSKRDLFEIDTLVQRGFYYATLSGLVSAAYLGLAAVATHVLHLFRAGQSTAFSLAFTIAVLLLLPKLRDRVQRFVDVIFGRRTYDAPAVLAAASKALGATLSLDEILRLTLTVPSTTLGLGRVAVFLRGADGFAEAACEPPRRGGAALWLPADGQLGALLASLPQPLIREKLVAGTLLASPECLPEFDALEADLIVPLGCQGVLTGFLVCGRPRAGSFFNAGDVSFLHTFANQAALSLQNARTFHDLELLNVDLERRVEERTQQLADSLDQLGTAYSTLQASQEQLIAAQKMAAFGRLAAGIAHEMNTPLGAALNGLKIAGELVAECEAGAADPTWSVEERQAAFHDLAQMVASVEEWTRNAVAYIKSVKSQGRTTTSGSAASIDLVRLLDRDLRPLLMHRLRLVGGDLDLQLPSDLPELFGDATRLGQVLVNLINNAIDATEGLPPERTRIVVEAVRDETGIVVHVRDRGVGIAADARDHIFTEFYTTKPLGKGTGLGLSIARDIISGEFGGTLACTASGPEGTTFTIRLPLARTLPAPDAGRSAA